MKAFNIKRKEKKNKHQNQNQRIIYKQMYNAVLSKTLAKSKQLKQNKKILKLIK